jgi:hypothetical protein
MLCTVYRLPVDAVQTGVTAAVKLDGIAANILKAITISSVEEQATFVIVQRKV